MYDAGAAFWSLPMSRHISGRESARNTRFSRQTVQHHMSHAEEAREHVSVRNRLVVTVAAYAAALKQRQGNLNPQLIKEHKARWQNFRSKQRVRSQGSYELTFEPQRGYAVMEAAHFLPCSIDYNSRDFSALGRSSREAEILRAPFAEVHDLHAIFNDADQAAEDAGLRKAFEALLRHAFETQMTDPQRLITAYHQIWKPQALAAYQAVLGNLQPLRQKEIQRRQNLERNRFTGFTEEDLTTDRDASFYDDMHEIVSIYAAITATQNPINLQAPEIERHIGELQTANNEPGRRLWPKTLELAK
jgi:hypothetical protein